jgi:hypothetical protein
MNKTERTIIEWIAQCGHEDVSCRAMAFYLGFGVTPRNAGRSHPWGAGSIAGCISLLDDIPSLRKKLPEMALLSREWKRIIAAWEQLEECYRAESNLQQHPRPMSGTTNALVKAFLAGKRPRRRRAA